ncbi:epimerase [Lentzea aerocolonigenes]|uniref:Epimerase n=1 Tax=Lentzea aerocolonigenes TaxID=68170 RepID=A0A0F0GHF6_LENAE|nr:NAD-dependent epimerase/dehydratase family protein [Lentzea aerocolonigenes]KJK42815.1 epimerase [Lentzea aerocolonigenes]
MTVLVTGGTGFVAGWTIAQLLSRGYDVRTTTRGRRPAVEGDHEVVRADLTSDDGWASAMSGVKYVLHVASPLGGSGDLIGPARDGTLRVLRHAVDAGVSRVVMTSSCAAATPPPGSTGTFDETLWTDPSLKFDEYRRSKLLAERAAWEFMRDKETSFVTVLPGAVFGPVRSRSNSGSVRVIGRMLDGMPGVPRVGLNIVDVRDVADLHIRAMTSTAAAGERFIAVSEFMWMADVARVLDVPARSLPNFVVRAASLVARDLRPLVPMLGRSYTYSHAKASSVLGWDPRPARTTVLECAASLSQRAS